MLLYPAYKGKFTFLIKPNVIEIEGLLLPGFGPMCAHKGAQNFSTKELHFLNALVTSLDGKNWKDKFSMEARTLGQNPGIANLLFQ